jgi:catechol 2,3-dioxygenase-like lactoylglutathione lyase family enzyme
MLSIDHIQLAIPAGGEEQARGFFVDVLGMNEDQKPEALARRGGCWFRAGSVRLHCGVEASFAPQRKAHPAFLVGNLEELAPKLTSAGVKVVPDDSLPDRKRFYAEDPFGNRIEFMADEDGFSQR